MIVVIIILYQSGASRDKVQYPKDFRSLGPLSVPLRINLIRRGQFSAQKTPENSSWGKKVPRDTDFMIFTSPPVTVT